MWRKRTGMWLGAAVSLLLVAAVAAWLVPQGVQADKQLGNWKTVQVARTELAKVEDLSTAFHRVAVAVRPSVVSIRTVRHVRQAADVPRPEIPEEFRRFFDDDLFERFFHMPQMPREFQARGQGSGVIVSSEGYILSNNHVVRGAERLEVKLADGRKFPAKVVGSDPKTDLAVLKIDATGLIPAKLGDSDKTKVGEWVLAIGSPFGLDLTVTAGIISAKGRSNIGVADYEDFLQTDAAINPGNSGGPLVNMRGEVIGINTAIRSGSGVNAGVGFAIPSNMARRVMDSLIRTGRVDRGYLGVGIQDLNEQLARSFGYDKTQGVVVSQVMPGSPAHKAGFQVGDIIVRYNGKLVEDAHHLRHLVADTEIGTRVPVVVFRKGREHTLQVTVGRLPSDQTVASAGTETPAPQISAERRLGLHVQQMTGELAQRFGYQKELEGVVVVRSEGVARLAGIRPGDVILSVGDVKVKSLEQFRQALAKHDLEKGVRLLVRSPRGATRFVFIAAEAE